MVRRSSGTTLIELLVVMSVWIFVLTAILGFYIYATKINRKNDKMSAQLRAVQQIADKMNTVLRHADIREVYAFPPTVIFNRLEEDVLHIPGALLPNLRPETEFIGLAPDPRRAGANADPRTCQSNALYLGKIGQPGYPLMQLPDGVIAAFQLTDGLLIMKFNHPQFGEGGAPEPAQDPYKAVSDARWTPINHYFTYRGLATAQFIP